MPQIDVTLASKFDGSGFTALEKKLDAGREQVAKFGEVMAGAFGVGLGIEGVKGFIENTIQFGKQLTDLSNRLGITTTAFQVLGEVARENGLDEESMTAALGRLHATISKAAIEGGTASEAFRKLGLDAKTLADAPLEQAFEAIAYQVVHAKDQTEAYSAAVEILGTKNVPKLLAALKQLGTEGLGEAAKKGIILSPEDVHALDEAALAWERIEHSAKVIGARATVEAGGIIEEIVDTMWIGPFHKLESAIHGIKNLIPAGWNIAGLERDKPAAEAKPEGPKSNALVDASKGELGLDPESIKLAQDEANAEDAARLKSIESGEKVLAERLKERDAILAQADAQQKLRLEVEKINALRGVKNGLTNDEANAAVAEATFRINGGFTPAIEAAREALKGYDLQLNAVAANPTLTDAEKHAARVKILREENAEIERQTAALKALIAAHKGENANAALGMIGTLNEKGAATNLEAQSRPETLAERDAKGVKDLSDPSKHYQSAGAGFAGSLMQQVSQIGTFGDQINRTFAQVGQSIRSSLGGAFADMLLKSGSFASKVHALWNSLVTSAVQSGAQMAADWAFKHAIMGAVSRLFHTQDVTMHVTGEATKTGVTAAGTGTRILLGIKEGMVWLWQAGVKAMSAVANIPYVGPFLAIAALAAILAGGVKAMKGFEKGGVIGGGEQVIRVNEGNRTESVLNANATAALGHDWINAANSGRIMSPAAAITRPGYQPSGYGGNSSAGSTSRGRSTTHGGTVNVTVADGRNPRFAEHMKRDPGAENFVVDTMLKHRAKLGIKV